jgi:hypothetical protein
MHDKRSKLKPGGPKVTYGLKNERFKWSTNERYACWSYVSVCFVLLAEKAFIFEKALLN